jgi:hypothetical protein
MPEVCPMTPNRTRLRSLEALGFYHGVQLVSPKPTEAEIGARFDHDMHRIRHDAVDSLKQLEAQTAVLTERQLAAAEHWHRLEVETGGLPPEVAMPFVASVAAILAIAGETLLLAPVMDGFGIAEPLWQHLTAATLVIVASGLVHMTLGRIVRAESAGDEITPFSRVTTILLSGFALITITALGWWRGTEMIYAAEAHGGEWARFLQQAGVLTVACVTLLTIGLPLFAAASSEWSFGRLRYAREWRTARRRDVALKAQHEATQKAMQAVAEKRDRQIHMLEEQKQTWLHTYREHYLLGQRTGACQQALWRVLLHIAAVALLIASSCLLLDVWLQSLIPTGRMLLYSMVTLGLGGLYAYIVLEAWNHPTPNQLYRRRAVIWRPPFNTPVFDSEDSSVPPSETTCSLEPSRHSVRQSRERAVAGLGLLALASLTAACDSSPRSTRQIVYLLDTSASILTDAHVPLAGSVVHTARSLDRGELLTIVPIAAEASSDTPGRILRFRRPHTREPYDADRQRFVGEVTTRADTLLKRLVTSPARNTDLLGAFDMAVEELSAESSVDRRIVCLSDFLQDDRQLDFRHATALADVHHAERTALQLSTALGRRLAGVGIYLGLLQSRDLRQLSPSRQAAVRTFWGATVLWKTDGLGHVATFLSQVNNAPDSER